MAWNTLKLLNKRFGRLTVLKQTDTVKGQTMWLCKCDCGNTAVVRGTSLNTGATVSCGCFRNEEASRRALKHGDTRDQDSISVEYTTWRNMKARCYNPNHISFPYCGANGITVCSEWLDNFPQFLKDMGRRPSGKYSLDRIDNNKGYSKGNCRWATPETQMNNMTINRILTFNDKSQTVSQWSREIGLTHFTIHARLKRGWSVEKTLTTPLRGT